MNKLLLVVDMQNDFITGALGTKEASSIVEAVCREISSFDGQILYTRDTHAKNYMETQEGKNLPVPHCIRDTEGWELHPAVSRLQNEKNSPVIDKETFGSRQLPEMVQEHCQGIPEEIEIIGLCTDICVISNALLLKAFFPETRITVKAGCCAGVTPKSHQTALDAMKMCQIIIL